MLAENIYALRRKSGLSQEQLAEKIGVSRQAISKWEGGLSTPELDKLRALSELFQVTIDELTREQGPDADSGARSGDAPPGGGPGESRLGIGLCILGAVCLIASGLLLILRPSAVNQINESSTVTLNGSGLLMLLFLLMMIAGVILTLKKK